MRLFWELLARSVRRQLTYRAALLAGLTTNFFFGLLRAAVLLALLGEREQVQGYGAADLLTYTALTQALLVFLSVFGWWDLMLSVQRGEIASDLLRPVGLLRFWMAQDLGRAVVGLLLRGVALLALFALVFDLVVPQGAARWAALLAALLLAWLLSFAFRFLVNLAAFWSPDARGIGRFAFVVAMFCSGFLMPLSFFPEWVRALAYLTPFPHMLNTVVEVYLGKVQGRELLLALAAQAAWAAGLLVLAQFVLSRAMRRLVIQGG